MCTDEYSLDLGPLGSVHYTHEDGRLLQIDRLSSANDVVYTHFYRYSNEGVLVSEKLIGDLGEIIYNGSSITSPYCREEISYNEDLHLIQYRFDDVLYEYRVGSVNELITVNTRKTAVYDELGRVIQIENTYFEYNDSNQLMTVNSPEASVTYGYNDNGLRDSRTINGETESFIHLGINEIALMNTKGFVTELRIPGLSHHKDILHPIAIETEDAIYAPIHDVRGNIVKLINIHTKEVISLTVPNPFGQGLDQEAPTKWIFANKHYDSVTNLVYFGYRYYSPDLQEWLTPDPLAQTTNLYEYCFNNPFFYTDPDGRFSISASFLQVAWGAGLTISAPILGPTALVMAGAAALAYGGSEVYKNYKNYQYMESRKEKEGKQKDGTPKAREAQDKQFQDALRDIERRLGRKLDPSDHRKLHDNISGRNYDYHDIVEEGVEILKKGK